MKKVLVTGGTGMFGSNVLGLLAQKKGYQVFSTFHPADEPNKEWRSYAHWIKADLTDPKQTERVFRHKFDYLIHLAALVRATDRYSNTPATILTNNLKIDTNVFSNASKKGIKRITYLTTHDLLYPVADKKLKEGDIDKIVLPKGGYEFSRLSGETLCKLYQKQLGLEYVILRVLEYSYGTMHPPKDKKGYRPLPLEGIEKSDLNKGWVPVLIELIMKILSGQKIIRSKGDPKQKRFWIHLQDTASAIIQSMEKKEALNQEIYLGTGERESIENIAGMIFSYLYPDSKPQSVKFTTAERFPVKDMRADYDKARQLLGWKPKHNLKKSLPDMIEWVKKEWI